MITYISGDLFESPAQVLVNTVNIVGVMGKGIALKFKRIYPEMFDVYRNHCEQGNLEIGQLLLYKTPNKWILNFPTKKHWRNPSKVEYIEAGLQKLQQSCSEMAITSIAFPELGCGNGELDFESQVKPLMEKHLGQLSIPTFICIGGLQIDRPEHKDVSHFAEWLRSEPSALPFSEVWQDILQILCCRRDFLTQSRGNPYTAQATENPATITVESSHRKYKILSDQLLEFWQQLRDFGLTHGSIAPEHRFASYLIPIFSELSYVRPVVLSDSLTGLKFNPARGIQVVPPPISSEAATGELFTDSDYAAQG